ncbi:MAG: ABC transporter permease [Deltaproteobacteria bacterium]|nr:ABC transporter permease [Nannocystaceae bacterium]
MSARQVRVVLAKELTDGLRDRRSLFSALIFPLVGPVLVVLMFKFIADRESTDEPVPLPVIGAEHAPGLVAYLAEHDVEVLPAPDDPEGAVKRGDVPAVLVIDAEYPQRFREARPAPLELMVDNSRQDGHGKVRRAQRAIEGYAAELGAMRLLLRGVDPKLAAPVALAEHDLATPQKQAANVLGIIGMYVMMAAFIGGMYVATDATAGERERGSLEPLLSNPVDRTSLALGKWLATCVLSCGSQLFTLFTSGIALSRAPLEELGVELHFTAVMVLQVIAMVLPAGLLASALQLLIATFARSFREAQTYLTMLTLLPAVPGMMLMLSPMDSTWWSRWVPILGQQLGVSDILRGEPVAVLDFVIPTLVAVGLALASVRACAWLLGREKIVFGG